MGITIYPQSSALGILYNAALNHNQMFRAMERLSSGLRTNRASDDPAGLVISEQLRSRIGSLNQEIDNISAVISKYETVSSSVGNLRSQLTELRSLAVGASNEAVNSEEAQAAYNQAAQSIVETYNDTIENATYNGSNTLDGSEGSLADLFLLTDIDLSDAESAQAAIERIDQVVQDVDTTLVDLGAQQKNELESRRASLEIERQNIVSAESQIRDADFGETYATYVGAMIREKASLALLAHSLVASRNVLTILNM